MAGMAQVKDEEKKRKPRKAHAEPAAPPPHPTPGIGKGMTLEELKAKARELAGRLGHVLGPFTADERNPSDVRQPAYHARCVKCRFPQAIVSPERYADRNQFLGGTALTTRCEGKEPVAPPPPPPPEKPSAAPNGPAAAEEPSPQDQKEEGSEMNVKKKLKVAPQKREVNKGAKRPGTKREKAGKGGAPRLRVFDQPVAPVVKFLIKEGITDANAIRAALKGNGCEVGAVRHLIARVKDNLKDTPDADLTVAQKAALKRAAKAE